MVRRVVAAAALLALGFAGTGSAVRNATAPLTQPLVLKTGTLAITGHGWGHGVGMSQWGAYGYALHGWDASRILLHYYPGTTLGTHPGTLVRVLLVDGAGTAALGSAAAWRVVDAAGTKLKLPAGDLTLRASLKLRHKPLVSPLTFRPGKAPVEVGGHPYRGSLTVLSDGTKLQIVNDVQLESYVDGVVGEEVSAAWPQAALEAQAIAARSYALSQLARTGAASPFDLYADGRSQVYGGIDAESPAITQAATATARRVVLYDGAVATTYFSSSSGGRTADSDDTIGFAVPYLVSVADPWDTYSPYHDWGPIVMSTRAAAKELGLHGPLVDLELESAPDGRVISVTAATANKTVTLTGAQLRDDLGLRSDWFQLQWGGEDDANAAWMIPRSHAP
jgi:stage II sporulation protein D